ncbi:MAG TPA: hypothetical protein VGK78_15975 [Nocardioides sp.]|uniref:hypothetical protein n=1 Tax=Nocardioides sp. TaxID=35761 RepID=UPI002F3E8227
MAPPRGSQRFNDLRKAALRPDPGQGQARVSRKRAGSSRTWCSVAGRVGSCGSSYQVRWAVSLNRPGTTFAELIVNAGRPFVGSPPTRK